MAGKYNSIDELIQDLKSFKDIEFGYNGREYSICPVHGIYAAGEAWEPSIEFETIDELLENFRVQGKKLEEIITDIELYLH